MTAQFKARPTTYRGIQMRSRLEARAASMLDAAGIDWQYEPRAFRTSDGGEYLPDFQIGPTTFVEVKPWLEEGRERELQILDVRRAMTILTEAEPGTDLWCLYSTGVVVHTNSHAAMKAWLYAGWCAAGHASLYVGDVDACVRCGSELIVDTSSIEYRT